MSSKRQIPLSKLRYGSKEYLNIGRIILPGLLSHLRFLLRIFHCLILFCLWNRRSCSSFFPSRIVCIIFLIMTLKYIHYLFICLLPLLNYSDSQAIESLNLYVLFQNKNFPNVSDCFSHDFNQTYECWRIGWPSNIKMWVGIEISVTKSLYQLASRKECFSSSL